MFLLYLLLTHLAMLAVPDGPEEEFWVLPEARVGNKKPTQKTLPLKPKKPPKKPTSKRGFLGFIVFFLTCIIFCAKVTIFLVNISGRVFIWVVINVKHKY
jgi:hypothetical protein